MSVEMRFAIARRQGWVIEWDYFITHGIPRLFVKSPDGEVKKEAFAFTTIPAEDHEALLDRWGIPRENDVRSL